MENDLYLKLYELRESIKQADTSGRMPLVCNDKALQEIARLKPKHKEDLLCISGLGKTFVDKYGDIFMEVLTDLHDSTIKNNVLTPSVKETLKNLENRLININKRNRLLYMPKITPNFSYDLVKAAEKNGNLKNVRLSQFIREFDSAKRFIINEVNGETVDFSSIESDYKKISNLLREVSRSKRESGENELYIAYPFVIGKIAGENFDVRAPLALFPVEVIREGGTVCLKMDTSKDVLYNSSFILTISKFSASNAEMPNIILEEVQSKFVEQVTTFYGENGITIIDKKEGLQQFIDYTAATFPKFQGGEFYLQENAVLGKFSTYSSALQKDFKSIRENSQINELLNNLLQRYEDIDIYSDSEERGEPLTTDFSREKSLNFINDLNISQECAIHNINMGNSLVIQGPPGTGKSQTITSMIADFVNKGKNVLMVSQKKAALDVIYSRLGKLSKYALIISDVKDKDNFYEQLENILSAGESEAYSDEEFNHISDTIDADLERLTAIADSLYYDLQFGTGVNKIYEEGAKHNFNYEDVERVNAFSHNIPLDLYKIGYENAKKYSSYFSKSEACNFSKTYYDIFNKFPYIAAVKPHDKIQILSAIKDADTIVDLYCQEKSKGFFRKIFSGHKVKKAVKKYLKAHFDHFNKKELKALSKNPVELYNCMESFIEFDRVRGRFNSIDEDAKLYFGAIYNVYLQLGDLDKVVSDMVKYFAYYYINEFENNNREIVLAIDNFDLIVGEISQMLDAKKEVTKKRLKHFLVSSSLKNIGASKRSNDMQRIIESKRKWNIARFLNKFSFELMNGVKIWLLTPEIVSEILPLENGMFDLLVFDEASQIYIEKGVPGIARAKKVVITGDHKQLRPSSLGFGRIGNDEDEEELNAALEEESLLDLARFKYPEVLLNYHYRSKYEELIAFSNYAFYKGRLNVSPNTMSPSSPPIQVHYIENGLWDDRKNAAEAEKVVGIIRNFLFNNNDKETMGVITFNSSQRDLILDKLDALCMSDSEFSGRYLAECNRKDNGEDVGLFVKNIENVQGDERDNIVFSLAYAKNTGGKLVRNFGWLNQSGGENRLNVAISRAKKHIEIVTSIYPEDLKVTDLANDGPRILKKYLEYAYFISAGDGDSAKEVLYSFVANPTRTMDNLDSFVGDVEKELLEAGLDVTRSFGMGSYKIDLAVKVNGKYVLGVECDSVLYKNNCARERDVHRKRYLQARGWKLFRVWSSEWWKNSKAVIADICAKCENK